MNEKKQRLINSYSDDYAAHGFSSDNWSSNTMIPRIKFTRMFLKTLKRIEILPCNPMPQHEVELMAQHPEWAENIIKVNSERMPEYTGLKQCKDHVERLKDIAIDNQILGD